MRTLATILLVMFLAGCECTTTPYKDVKVTLVGYSSSKNSIFYVTINDTPTVYIVGVGRRLQPTINIGESFNAQYRIDCSDQCIKFDPTQYTRLRVENKVVGMTSYNNRLHLERP